MDLHSFVHYYDSARLPPRAVSTPGSGLRSHTPVRGGIRQTLMSGSHRSDLQGFISAATSEVRVQKVQVCSSERIIQCSKNCTVDSCCHFILGRWNHFPLSEVDKFSFKSKCNGLDFPRWLPFECKGDFLLLFLRELWALIWLVWQ